MKQLRSILLVVFAILVLLSSSSFMVGIHLCGGKIQHISVLTKADGCQMEKVMPPCHKPQQKPCCEDESIFHQGEDFNVSITDVILSPAPAPEMELPPVIISEIIPSAPVSRTHFYHYNPPLRAADLTISLQVFLI